MSAGIRTIMAKTGTSSQKARATASKDDGDSDDVALATDDAVEDDGAAPAAPPPGMGKLVDKTI